MSLQEATKTQWQCLTITWIVFQYSEHSLLDLTGPLMIYLPHQALQTVMASLHLKIDNGTQHLSSKCLDLPNTHSVHSIYVKIVQGTSNIMYHEVEPLHKLWCSAHHMYQWKRCRIKFRLSKTLNWYPSQPLILYEYITYSLNHGVCVESHKLLNKNIKMV